MIIIGQNVLEGFRIIYIFASRQCWENIELNFKYVNIFKSIVANLKLRETINGSENS